MQDKSVLFVCLGNICRSPMAEAILRNLVSQRKDSSDWKIDSCGTASYHTGKQPDQRTLTTLKNHDIDFSHKARTFRRSDFDEFRWIFVMDVSNYSDIKELKPDNSKSELKLLRYFDPDKDCEKPSIIDAYYEDDECFELCYQQCLKSLNNFLTKHSLDKE